MLSFSPSSRSLGLNFSEWGCCSGTSLALIWCWASYWYVTLPVVLNQCLVCRHSICGLLPHLLSRAAETHWSQASKNFNCTGQFLRLLKAMRNLVLVFLGLLLFPQQAHSKANCKPVTASFCQSVGYTTTLHPSGVTGFSLQQTAQIVETACSPEVATLMCRVVVPECGSEDDSRMKPCRALCEKVKRDCDPALKAKRLFWPMRLRCETLPESNCVGLQVSVKRHHLLFWNLFCCFCFHNIEWSQKLVQTL